MAEAPEYPPGNICGENIFIDSSCIVSPRALISSHGGGSITIKAHAGISDFAYIVAMGGDIVMGEHAGVQVFCVLYGHGGLTIGNFVRIGPHTVIIPGNHNFDRLDIPICAQGISAKGVVIEDDVWIGAGCRILDGVTIGMGSVIGAGSVVTKSIPPYSVAVGVPARVIRKRNETRALEPSDERLLS